MCAGYHIRQGSTRQTTSEWSEWKSLSCVRLFATHGLYCPWNSLGQNIGEGSLSLLQGIFPTQGLNQGLLHCRQTLYQLSYQGSTPVGYTIKTLQATGFCDGGHLGKSEIHRSGCQEGQAEGNFHTRSEATLHTWNFYFKEASTLLSRLFNWLDQAYPDYLEYIHLPKVSWFFFQLYWGIIDKLLDIKSVHHDDFYCMHYKRIPSHLVS